MGGTSVYVQKRPGRVAAWRAADALAEHTSVADAIRSGLTALYAALRRRNGQRNWRLANGSATASTLI